MKSNKKIYDTVLFQWLLSTIKSRYAVIHSDISSCSMVVLKTNIQSSCETISIYIFRYNFLMLLDKKKCSEITV